MKQALGLIETIGFIGVTEAADAAVKAASVELSAIERIDGGLVSIRLLGDVGAVQAAVEAGAQAAQKVGTLKSCHVIPNPHDDLVRLFQLQGTPATTGTENLEELSVHRLRQIARETPGLSIQGREISRANRDQLLQELRRAREKHKLGGLANAIGYPVGKIKHGLKESATTAAIKAEHLGKLGRVRLDIARTRKALQHAFSSLGGQVCDLLEQNPDTMVGQQADVQAHIQTIKDLKAQLALQEAEFQALQATPHSPVPLSEDEQ